MKHKTSKLLSILLALVMVAGLMPLGQVVYAAGEAPVITTDGPLPHAWVGQPYSAQLTATGSTPITWTNPLTFLPDGLTLDSSTGVISGIPTTTSNGFHMFTAKNEYGHDTKNISLYVFDEDSKPSITTSSLPNGTVGSGYNQKLNFTGVTWGGLEWSIISGNLPNGLNFDGGTISGFPTIAGTYSFTVKVTNAAGTTQKDFIINIDPADNTIDYSVTPTDVTIPTSTVGYIKWGLEQTITIKNNSDFKVSYNINDSSLVNFEVYGFRPGDREYPGHTSSFRILPKSDLTPGTYNETLKMEIWQSDDTTNRITKNINITFTVTASSTTQHQVTFEVGAGTMTGTNPVMVNSGEKVTKPSDPIPPANHRFVGWYKDSAFNNEFNFDTETIEGATSIYAKYIETFNVEYDVNGGSKLNLTDEKVDKGAVINRSDVETRYRNTANVTPPAPNKGKRQTIRSLLKKRR